MAHFRGKVFQLFFFMALISWYIFIYHTAVADNHLSTENKNSSAILHDSQNRVQAMSMIHETLYSSDNLLSMDMNNYFTKLIKTIFQSYGDINRRVNYKIETNNNKIGVKQATLWA
jgi:two-component sensor histidine kinase